MSNLRCVRFEPSKVHGLHDVTEVAVFLDHLEVVTAGRRVTFRFQDFAQTLENRFVRRVRQLLGLKVSTPAVAYVWKGVLEFHTTPVIEVFLPEQSYDDFVGTIEWQVKRVIEAGAIQLTNISEQGRQAGLRFSAGGSDIRMFVKV